MRKTKTDMDVFSKPTRTTISMPALLYADAQDRKRQKRLSTFSDYVQDLIRADTRNREEKTAA